MKTGFLLIALLLVAAPVAAQEPVPVSKEPRHHLKFENEYVRVFDVTVPAHDTTLYHIHSNDYAFVNLSDVTLKAQPLGRPESDLAVKVGQTVFTKGPITHRVSNPNDVPFRNITIEVLKNPGTSAEPEATDPAISPVLDNERIMAERIVLQPGESIGMHTFPRMGLWVTVVGSRVSTQCKSRKASVQTPRPGEFTWYGEPRTCSIKNVGNSRFEAMQIEWK